jgi:predicted Fe-Mo cluster-binding NifX family protein
MSKQRFIIKIAIPTDDGLIVRQHFKGSRGFVVATMKAGMIIYQEMRWNFLSEIMTSEYGFFYNLVDCDLVMVNEIGNGQRDLLKVINKEIVLTDQTEIAQAFIDYLDSIPRKIEVRQTT